jgi:lysophospholipase L1-like esterase
MSKRRVLILVPTAVAAVLGFLATQVLRAAYRRDLPSFPNQDPSGTFGDASLPHLRIVALGDSSITAPGIENLDDTWIRQVANDFSDRYCVELIAIAVGGSRARDVVEGQLGEALRLRPDIALVSVGANDAIRATTPTAYREDLQLIADSLEDVGAAVVLMGVGDLGSIPRLPRSLRPILTRRAASFNAAAEAVAARSATIIKIHVGGRMSTAFWDDPGLFGPDHFHAGPEGHRVFAEEMLPGVRAALAIARAKRVRE